jgi:hypothetical protein
MPNSPPDTDGPRDPAPRWIVGYSPQGHGTYLVGEDEEDVLVLAPPGVRLPTTAGSSRPLCADGWRLATFTPVAGQPPLVDRHRPTTLEQLSVVDALVEVLVRCPEHVVWLGDRLEELVRSTWLISQPDVNGDVPRIAAQRRAERDELLAELVPMLQQLESSWPVEQIDLRLADPEYLVTLRDRLDAIPGALQG